MRQVLVEAAVLEKAKRAYVKLKVAHSVCKCLLFVCLSIIGMLTFQLSKTIDVPMSEESTQLLEQINETPEITFETIELPPMPQIK